MCEMTKTVLHHFQHCLQITLVLILVFVSPTPIIPVTSPTNAAPPTAPRDWCQLYPEVDRAGTLKFLEDCNSTERQDVNYNKDFLFPGNILLYTVNSHSKANVRLPTSFDLRCSRFEFVPVPASFEQKLGVHPRVCCPKYIRCEKRSMRKFNQLFSALMRFVSPLIHSAQLMCL